MTVARKLAAFLTATKTMDLPVPTLDHAAMIVASTLASAACGTGIESAKIIRAMARERGGRPDASVWFDAEEKLPVASAIQVNAVLSDAAASDDSDLRNIVHAGTPLTAAALAFAERDGADGAAVLTAIVLGYEAAGRISAAITPGFKDRGFHGCLGAAFASAVASARMLGLDAEQLAQTIALTAVSIGGLATAADTSVSREYHAGLAAMHGANAALAAQRGFVGEARILEAPRGFFEAFGVWSARPLAQAFCGIWGTAGISARTWRSSWCRVGIPITPSPKPPAMRPERAGSSRLRLKPSPSAGPG